MNASLVIPALNEEDSLPHVLDAIDRDLLLEVILVDGGSHDRTVAIAEDTWRAGDPRTTARIRPRLRGRIGPGPG